MAANKSSLHRQMTSLIVLPLDAGFIQDMAYKVELLSSMEEPKRHYRQSGFCESPGKECG
jgi:hypothetical protein